MRFLTSLVAMWRQFRAFDAALSYLGALSDRDLAELGVARPDVVQLAYAEAERQAELWKEGRLWRLAERSARTRDRLMGEVGAA